MIGAAVLLMIVVPVAVALVTWAARLSRVAGPLALVSSLVMLGCATLIGARVYQDGPQTAGGELVYVDSLSVIILVLITFIGVCAVLNSLHYVDHDVAGGELRKRDLARYYALLLVFMATMATVPVVNNLGVMWVAIEATTIVSVLLVSIYRTGPALEAAWKYLVIGSVGIALALFGTMMTYYASSSILGDGSNALSWTELQRLASGLDPRVMRLAFIFVLVGYGTKAGLAPMHTWLPDAHSQAPSPVSGLLSGVLLNCALYAVLRFRILAVPSVGAGYADHLLIGFGLFSIAIAVPFLVVQNDIKRMLGYHSVEHMGIIVLAIGIGGPVCLYAAMLHLVAHSLTKSSLFFAAGSIVQAFHTRSMHRMRGLLKVMPIAGGGLMVGVFGLAGLPPLAMFTSEFGLVAGAFQNGRGAVAVVAAILITLAAISLLYHSVEIAYRQAGLKATVHHISAPVAASVLLPLALLIWISVAPPHVFVASLDRAVVVLEGGQ